MSTVILFRKFPVAAAAAMLLAAFGAASVSLPADAATKITRPAASLVKKVVLKTGIADGKMVFLNAEGKINPEIRAQVGDTLDIEISSGEGAQHDIVIPELKVASSKFDGRSGPTHVTFKLTQAGDFAYFCSVAGHRQIGMEGMLKVSGPGDALAAVPVTTALLKVAAQKTAATPAADAAPRPTVAAAKPGASTPAAAAAAKAPAAVSAADARLPAAADAVSVVMDPTAVPAPIGARAPELVKYRIETVELVGKLADGTTFTYWTFDRKVPGPMLRVKQGDSVQLTLANAADSKNIHSIDLHGVTGPGGAAEFLQVPPGQEKTVTFKALNPGLYVYHCATASVPEHISAGMYGLILVEPPEGLAKVDREFYVMQGDIYTHGKTGEKGHQPFDHDKLAAEQPEYYVFNGAVGALTKEHRLQAKVGETVRIYFGVGGPNKISSFHVIGEIFDKVYSEGSISSVKKDVQTTLVAPGGATIVEFKVEVPGKYVLVDHALSRVGKGLAGFLDVTGPADPSIYRNHEAH